MAGPLSARLKKPEPVAEPEPVQAAEPAKKKKPPPKLLKIFDGFDERGYYPTMMYRLERREDGAIVGIRQQWRHRETDEAEWREVPEGDT